MVAAEVLAGSRVVVGESLRRGNTLFLDLCVAIEVMLGLSVANQTLERITFERTVGFSTEEGARVVSMQFTHVDGEFGLAWGFMTA